MAAKRKAAASVTASPEVVSAGEVGAEIPVTLSDGAGIQSTEAELHEEAVEPQEAPGVEPDGVVQEPQVSDLSLTEVGPEGDPVATHSAEAEQPHHIEPEPVVVESAPLPAPAVKYPVAVVLRNHSPFHLVEPVSGKFLPPGSSESVTLHDEAFASRVLDNVSELRRLHNLSEQALSVDGL